MSDEPDFGGGWNYRLVKKQTEREELIGVHEVYYNSDGEPRSCTKNPIGIQRESVEELAKEHFRMKQAFEKPVLEYESFGSSSNSE